MLEILQKKGNVLILSVWTYRTVATSSHQLVTLFIITFLYVLLILVAFYNLDDLESPGDGDLSNNLESPDNPELPSTSNIGSPTKRLHYPEQFFKFFKAGIKKGNSLYHCMVGDCKVKSKILSTTDDSRGNLKKHLKVTRKL